MSKNLDTDVLEVQVSQPPKTGIGPDAPPNLCFHCLCDNHHLCTRVECYRCPSELHNRLPGVAASMGEDDGKRSRFYHGDGKHGSRGY